MLSVLMGFGGVLLIVRPVSGELDPYLLFALAGALLTAAMQLVLKAMAGKGFDRYPGRLEPRRSWCRWRSCPPCSSGRRRAL